MSEPLRARLEAELHARGLLHQEAYIAAALAAFEPMLRDACHAMWKDCYDAIAKGRKEIQEDGTTELRDPTLDEVQDDILALQPPTEEGGDTPRSQMTPHPGPTSNDAPGRPAPAGGGMTVEIRPDSRDEFDELIARNAACIHFEMLSAGQLWVGINGASGELWHVVITAKKGTLSVTATAEDQGDAPSAARRRLMKPASFTRAALDVLRERFGMGDDEPLTPDWFTAHAKIDLVRGYSESRAADRRQALVQAGAYILAELDRLDRAEKAADLTGAQPAPTQGVTAPRHEWTESQVARLSQAILDFIIIGSGEFHNQAPWFVVDESTSDWDVGYPGDMLSEHPTQEGAFLGRARAALAASGTVPQALPTRAALDVLREIVRVLSPEPRLYHHMGHTHEIQQPALNDYEVAGRVRMLMRYDLNHESVCTLGRDRILHLSQTLTAARVIALAELDRLDRAEERGNG